MILSKMDQHTLSLYSFKLKNKTFLRQNRRPNIQNKTSAAEAESRIVKIFCFGQIFRLLVDHCLRWTFITVSLIPIFAYVDKQFCNLFVLILSPLIASFNSSVVELQTKNPHFFFSLEGPWFKSRWRPTFLVILGHFDMTRQDKF